MKAPAAGIVQQVKSFTLVLNRGAFIQGKIRKHKYFSHKNEPPSFLRFQ